MFTSNFFKIVNKSKTNINSWFLRSLNLFNYIGHLISLTILLIYWKEKKFHHSWNISNISEKNNLLQLFYILFSITNFMLLLHNVTFEFCQSMLPLIYFSSDSRIKKHNLQIRRISVHRALT